MDYKLFFDFRVYIRAFGSFASPFSVYAYISRKHGQSLDLNSLMLLHPSHYTNARSPMSEPLCLGDPS